MTILYGIATRRWPKWWDCVETWMDTASGDYPFHVVHDKTVVEAYQEIYQRCQEDILALIHDDVEIYEKGWDRRVLDSFNDPSVGMVGFGGGLGHGRPNLYQVPYHLPDLARQGFISNMREAEVHGSRFTGEHDVAVLDGFAVFVRRPILDKWGGFLGKGLGYYMWCENLCCEVRRQGYRIRMVGVDCHHIGGRTSTTCQVTDDYQKEHADFYARNRDMMPYRVPE